jgi:hypothetical protein
VRRISIICTCKELVEVQDRQIAEHSHNGIRCDRSGDRYISVRSGGSVPTTDCKSGCEIGIGPVFTGQGKHVGVAVVARDRGVGMAVINPLSLLAASVSGSGNNGSGSVN